MQVILPMSGFGERFRSAGYQVPKPLLRVEDKPVIQHVVEMFPGDHQFHFVCNREHLDDPAYRMRQTLEEICPDGNIYAIKPHRRGPVHAVQEIAEHLDPAAPTIVNYCDFTCYWNYADFERFVVESDCDGALPCYRGFHPHVLGSTLYAYVRERDRWAFDIQEKTPFTDDPASEFASSGTYYFRSASLMRDAFARMVAQGLVLNGEYYASLAYKPLFEDRKRVAVYELQHFMQWGTPGDFEEYAYWSSAFRNLVRAEQSSPAPLLDHNIIPMAGLGSRFSREGYATPKPMIPVSGKPMAARAALDLPGAEDYRFVVRSEAPGLPELKAHLEGEFPRVTFVDLAAPTDGQARTCLLALDKIDDEDSIAVGACDNGARYDHVAFRALLDDAAADIIVWGIRGYPGAVYNPHMYGWIAEQNGRIEAVSVKVPLDNPKRDPIVVGTFVFKRKADFVQAVQRMIDREARVNGEYYVDTCINDAIGLGLECRLFEIDSYLCWGTPNDLRTFEYWQSCFHKWTSHPYRLECDPMVMPEAAAGLDRKYAPIDVPRPARDPVW